VSAALPGLSDRRSCWVLNVSRARLRARADSAVSAPRLDEVLAERLRQLIALHPTYCYRRLWTRLRFGSGLKINRKVVYPVLRLKGWFVHQRTVNSRSRVSRTQKSSATQ
jgi:hypothetical protein